MPRATLRRIDRQAILRRPVEIENAASGDFQTGDSGRMVLEDRRERLLRSAGASFKRRDGRLSGRTHSGVERNARPRRRPCSATGRTQSGAAMNVSYCLRRARTLFAQNIASHPPTGPVTWAEFGEQVDRPAAFLHDTGLRKGDRAAVWMLN